MLEAKFGIVNPLLLNDPNLVLPLFRIQSIDFYDNLMDWFLNNSKTRLMWVKYKKRTFNLHWFFLCSFLNSDIRKNPSYFKCSGILVINSDWVPKIPATSKMKLFVTLVNGFQLLTNVTKNSGLSVVLVLHTTWNQVFHIIKSAFMCTVFAIPIL